MIYPHPGDSVLIQKSHKQFSGSDPTFTTKDFQNAIAAIMAMTAGPKQTDSLFQEA